MPILILTTEPLPFPGLAATGAGLRAWALAGGLRARGLEARIASAETAYRGVEPASLAKVGAETFALEGLAGFVREARPDAVLLQHWGLFPYLGEPGCPLAIDLAGPHLLERRYWGSADPAGDLAQKLAALARADFLCCSGWRQRDYFLAFAQIAGHDSTDPALLPVLPFCVDPEWIGLEAPGPWQADRFLYSGMLLPWQDPSRPLETLLALLEERGRGELLFLTGRHPTRDVSRGRFETLIERLRGSDRVRLETVQPFDRFFETIAGCGLAIDLMARNPERELAFPSRTAVYLARGLPVIFNDYSEPGDWIEQYGAGWRLDPEDGAGLRALLEGLLDDPARIEAARAGARRLASERLGWDRCVGPLADWCAAPRVREQRAAPLLDAGELEALRHERDELRGRRLVRLSEWLRR